MWSHKAYNLDLLSEYTNIENNKLIKVLDNIKEEIDLEKNQNKKIIDFIKGKDELYNLPEGTSLYLFRHGLFNKLINVDMNKDFRLNPYIKDIIIN